MFERCIDLLMAWRVERHVGQQNLGPFELRVVQQHGIDAHQNAIDTVTQLVNKAARLFIGDPLGITAASGNTPI